MFNLSQITAASDCMALPSFAHLVFLFNIYVCVCMCVHAYTLGLGDIYQINPHDHVITITYIVTIVTTKLTYVYTYAELINDLHQ